MAEVICLDMKEKNSMAFTYSGIKWEPMPINELFDIDSTQSSIDKGKLLFVNGKYPYLTRSEKNNGCDSFVCEQKDYVYDKGNVITIGLDTQTVFYQPHDFYTGQNIQVLRNKHMNKYIAMFFIPLIKKQLEKFNWGGNGATLGRLKKQKILVPMKQDKVDYDFMDKFMQQKEQELLSKYLKELIDNIDLSILNKRHKWQVVSISELFTEIQRGKRLKRGNHIKGQTPYVSSSAVDNGVDGFVGNIIRVRKFDNCLSIANSGSVGASFFHPYEFIASDHVTKLKNCELNKYVYLFLSVITSRLSWKYTFNHEINETRIKRERFYVPVKKDGSPDFIYMEKYMKAIEYKLIKRYFETRLHKA